MKKIIILCFAVLFTILSGCSTNKTHVDSGVSLNKIKFKCNILQKRLSSPFVTTIHSISDRDLLYFVRRDTCTSTIGTISEVDYGNSSFVITVDNHKPLRLKVSKTGKIVGFDKTSQERLSKRYYVLGVLETSGLFDNY